MDLQNTLTFTSDVSCDLCRKGEVHTALAHIHRLEDCAARHAGNGMHKLASRARRAAEATRREVLGS